MSGRSPPFVQAYQPTTFKERGVSVPFTMPLLAGARARHGERRAIELVVPNPSGGPGVYILSWSSIRALCRPTVHDSRLNQRLGTLPVLSPSTVRQAAQTVGSQGLAGRPAMQAALTAAASDRKDRQLTQFLLLLAITKQVEPSALDLVELPTEYSAELEQQARQIVPRIARRLDLTPDGVLSTLADIAEAFLAIGTEGQVAPARVPRLLESLACLRDELADWICEHCEDAQVGLADMIAGSADVTIKATETTLVMARAATQNMVGLLRNWRKAPEHVTDHAGRPEWLLDGWEHVILLWASTKSPAEQGAVMTEMAQLVPVLPLEVSEWVGMASKRDDYTNVCETIRLDKDKRMGAAVSNLTGRNERLRAIVV